MIGLDCLVINKEIVLLPSVAHMIQDSLLDRKKIHEPVQNHIEIVGNDFVQL
jgi:hypothetical protein